MSTMPKVLLGTLALNEMEWLSRLYTQHKDWPGLVRWVFVEGCDAAYARANPDLSTPEGFSIDGTSDLLADLARGDDRVRYVRQGMTEGREPAQTKCLMRQKYLDVANEVRPGVVVTLDADEFYTNEHQARIASLTFHQRYAGSIFHRREIWRPPSISGLPLFGHEVVGGFWNIPCCHWWRWHLGMCYRGNHNTPEVNGVSLGGRFTRYDRVKGAPEMVHLGFAATERMRVAKNHYYQERGEGRTDFRQWYVESRASWLNWKLGDPLPHGALVREYDGPVPEVFQERGA